MLIFTQKYRHFISDFDFIIKPGQDYIKVNYHFQSFFSGVMYLLLQWISEIRNFTSKNEVFAKF